MSKSISTFLLGNLEKKYQNKLGIDIVTKLLQNWYVNIQLDIPVSRLIIKTNQMHFMK